MKKTVSLLLALLTLLPLLLSCGGDPDIPTDDGDTAKTVDTASPAADTDDGRSKTDLPAGLNFHGAAYRIQNVECASYYDTLVALEQTEDKLNDAIYNCDSRLMANMNFVFTETKIPVDSAVRSIRQLVAAGDDSYDMYVAPDWRGYVVAQEGLALPISALPYVDVSREYWVQSVHRDMSIRGKLYFAFGDHNLSIYDSVNVLLFNKFMSEDLGLSDHYETVLSGAWTLDLMYENMKLALKDADGDGDWTLKDVYGITSHSKQILPCFWIASGIRCVDKDEEDVPYFTLLGDQKFDDLYQRLLMIMHDDYLLYESDGFRDYANNTLFIGGGALYNVVRVAFLNYYRDMPIDYGIIPYPKYDAEQDTYYSRTEGGYIHIYPVTLKQYELVGAVTEAMACASHNEVIPVYYDVVLKNKYARDKNSSAMLDLIYSNRIYDLGDTIFCGVIRDGVLAKKFKADDEHMQSALESLAGVAETAIQNYVNAFDKKDESKDQP